MRWLGKRDASAGRPLERGGASSGRRSEGSTLGHGRRPTGPDAKKCQPDTVSAALLLVRQALHVPRPCIRGWGLPSPVLKLAPQRRQTYILLLDIMAFGPGSPKGRAAVYSAWLWRNLTGVFAAEPAGADEDAGLAAERLVAMGGLKQRGGRERPPVRLARVAQARKRAPYCPLFAKSRCNAWKSVKNTVADGPATCSKGRF